MLVAQIRVDELRGEVEETMAVPVPEVGTLGPGDDDRLQRPAAIECRQRHRHDVPGRREQDRRVEQFGRLVERGGTLTIHPAVTERPIGDITSP